MSVTEFPAGDAALPGHAQQARWVSVEGGPIYGLDSGFIGFQPIFLVLSFKLSLRLQKKKKNHKIVGTLQYFCKEPCSVTYFYISLFHHNSQKEGIIFTIISLY